MAKFDVDSDLVRKLASLLEETGLGEIEYEAEGQRVRVAKPAVAGPAPNPAANIATEAPAAPRTIDESAGPPDAAAHPGAVTSPMVGTVYHSPAPGEPPFVRTGDSVTEGQTLMLVEAMKTFNEIKAARGGRVEQILVENGQPVEYGEILAIIV